MNQLSERYLKVMVRDNQQVRRSDVLFRIDRARFALTLQQADAVVAGRHALLDQAVSDLERYRALTTDAVSGATELQAKAAYDQAVADRAVAQLHLDRCVVYASVNGKISNMDLHPGTYVTAGGSHGFGQYRYPACGWPFRGNQTAAHSRW
jgi:multidrug resistance efflux pump